MAATLRRDGERLVFTGTLDRAACAALWKQAQPLLAGARVIALDDVDRVDSAGLALVAELAARHPGTTVTGEPTGLASLRAAYRLDDALGFAS